jgi:hypothetical protein
MTHADDGSLQRNEVVLTNRETVGRSGKAGSGMLNGLLHAVLILDTGMPGVVCSQHQGAFEKNDLTPVVCLELLALCVQL